MFAARRGYSIDYRSELMTPNAFTFKLTVPNDPAGGHHGRRNGRRHAAEYAELEGARPERRSSSACAGAAVKALRATSAASDAWRCLPPPTAQLTVTIGGESVSQPLPCRDRAMRL